MNNFKPPVDSFYSQDRQSQLFEIKMNISDKISELENYDYTSIPIDPGSLISFFGDDNSIPEIVFEFNSITIDLLKDLAAFTDEYGYEISDETLKYILSQNFNSTYFDFYKFTEISAALAAKAEGDLQHSKMIQERAYSIVLKHTNLERLLKTLNIVMSNTEEILSSFLEKRGARQKEAVLADFRERLGAENLKNANIDNIITILRQYCESLRSIVGIGTYETVDDLYQNVFAIFGNVFSVLEIARMIESSKF